LAKKILNDPAFISVTPKNSTTNADIEQHYYVIEEHERDNAIIRLLDATNPQKAVIFCRTKKEVDRLSTRLIAAGCLAKGLHGDMEQPQREEVIKAFRHGDIDMLIATDVAARGLNIKEITHVFNYHIPFDPESYVHRIGRTARAGQKGTAITLLTPMEYHSMQKIAKTVGTKLEQKQIPTLFEMKAKSAEKLAEAILRSNIDNDAVKIADELEKELDLAQIAYKAISLLSGKNDIVGPDFIGLDKKTFENFIKKIAAKEEAKRNQNGNRKRKGRSRHKEQSDNDKRSFGKAKSHKYENDKQKSRNKNKKA
jgi:ATP-dependent RNA helicase DeaD